MYAGTEGAERRADGRTVRRSDGRTVRLSNVGTASTVLTGATLTVRPSDRLPAYISPMPRPKSILWVDDEVESLTSHVLFLEEQGFAVETTTHGDDALVLLQRQPYGVVLLDEQMPGRRGLELFRAIRAIDHAMPVVMVTKSEETETLKDAIGADISDYLIKPVNPRQILSVVTRLLDGDRIRQQRLSRDFATRFRELEARRGGPLAWREWVELVAELAEWEVRLGQADEPGLQDALRTLQESLRQDFASYLQRNYARWLHDGDSDRPPLSVDIGAEFLRPVLDTHRQGAAGRGRLPAAGPVGHDPPAHQRAVRHRDRALLLDSPHGHAVRAERHLQRALSRGDQGPLPAVVDRQRGVEPQRARGGAADRAAQGADRAQRAGALREGLHRRRRRRAAQAPARAPGPGRA